MHWLPRAFPLVNDSEDTTTVAYCVLSGLSSNSVLLWVGIYLIEWVALLPFNLSLIGVPGKYILFLLPLWFALEAVWNSLLLTVSPGIDFIQLCMVVIIFLHICFPKQLQLFQGQICAFLNPGKEFGTGLGYSNKVLQLRPWTGGLWAWGQHGEYTVSSRMELGNVVWSYFKMENIVSFCLISPTTHLGECHYSHVGAGKNHRLS